MHRVKSIFAQRAALDLRLMAIFCLTRCATRFARIAAIKTSGAALRQAPPDTSTNRPCP